LWKKAKRPGSGNRITSCKNDATQKAGKPGNEKRRIRKVEKVSCKGENEKIISKRANAKALGGSGAVPRLIGKKELGGRRETIYRFGGRRSTGPGFTNLIVEVSHGETKLQGRRPKRRKEKLKREGRLYRCLHKSRKKERWKLGDP